MKNELRHVRQIVVEKRHVYIHEVKDTCKSCSQDVEDKEKEKHDEVFVVTIPQTIIDVRTVMIELFHALSTDHTMKSLD